MFLGLLAAAALVLGILQYRWIGAVSRAERDRLAASLQAGVNRMAQEFTSRVASASAAVTLPSGVEPAAERERQYAARYTRLRDSQNGGVIGQLYLVRPLDGSMSLSKLDSEKGDFLPVPWPPEWTGVRDRAIAKYYSDSRNGRGSLVDDSDSLVESPYLERAKTEGGNWSGC